MCRMSCRTLRSIPQVSCSVAKKSLKMQFYKKHSFASAVYAMAEAGASVRPSVCLFVTRRYCVKTTELCDSIRYVSSRSSDRRPACKLLYVSLVFTFNNNISSTSCESINLCFVWLRWLPKWLAYKNRINAFWEQLVDGLYVLRIMPFSLRCLFTMLYYDSFQRTHAKLCLFYFALCVCALNYFYVQHLRLSFVIIKRYINK